MDFSRQCKRFLNSTQYGREHFKRTLANISAIGSFKNVQKVSKHEAMSLHRIVVADNDLKTLFILNESDGQLLQEATVDSLVTFGLCCSSKSAQNFIYVSDYANNVIRKFDENLKELKKIRVFNNNKSNRDTDVEDEEAAEVRATSELNGPCSIALNAELNQIHVIDQKNCRVVCFDLATDEFVSEIELFREDVDKEVKYFKPNTFDLSVNIKLDQEMERLVSRLKLDFWPFGLYTKADRVYVTDWHRGMLCIYKNGELERRVTAPNQNNDKSRKILSRPRDVIMDSSGGFLITDSDRNSFCFLDHKGAFLFETRVPVMKELNENGIFGVLKIDANKIVFASNCAVYVLHLSA